MMNMGLVTRSNRYDPCVPWACFPVGEKEDMISCNVSKTIRLTNNTTNLLELLAEIDESVINTYVHCVIWEPKSS